MSIQAQQSCCATLLLPICGLGCFKEDFITRTFLLYFSFQFAVMLAMVSRYNKVEVNETASVSLLNSI